MCSSKDANLQMFIFESLKFRAFAFGSYSLQQVNLESQPHLYFRCKDGSPPDMFQMMLTQSEVSGCLLARAIFHYIIQLLTTEKFCPVF